MPSAEVAPREFVTCRQRAFAFSDQINTTSPVSLPPIGQRSGAQPVSRRRVDPVMDSYDYELPDYDDKRPSQREDRPKRWLPIWPWLVLLGLLAIAIGAVGPLVRG